MAKKFKVMKLKATKDIEEGNLTAGEIVFGFWCENLSAYVNLLDENYFDVEEFIESGLLEEIEEIEVKL
jgi:hypothetical protein